MERLTLAFFKCFFCCKNYNKLQLIEMNQNTVMINEEEIDYSDLIFDVSLFQVCLLFKFLENLPILIIILFSD